MYNLFVSSDPDAWNGAPWQIERSRCIREDEYTEKNLSDQYGTLDARAIGTLGKWACIFAYEAKNKLAPRFGKIRDVTVRGDQARIEYEVQEIVPFLSADDMNRLMFELDIRKFELNRTHWAVKDVDLAKELRGQGISLPSWAVGGFNVSVDISEHQFDVALSFPGEVRPLVEEIAGHLDGLIGPDACFYDRNYTAQIARPSLDVLLQDIYRNRSKLNVVFLSSDYQRKKWCSGVEFRAIRDMIAEREHHRVMFVRTDDGSVEGVFATDGYVDARRFSAAEIADFIQQRVHLLSSNYHRSNAAGSSAKASELVHSPDARIGNSAEQGEILVEIEPVLKRDETGGLLVEAQTNLPDGFQVMITLQSVKGPLLGQASGVISKGRIIAGPFTRGELAHPPDNYIVCISSAMPALQPQSIREIIGQLGGRLTGALVARESSGNRIDFSRNMAAP